MTKLHRFIFAAVALAAVLLCFTPARAGEDEIELAAIHADVSAAEAAEEIDGTGTAYSIAWTRPVSKHGLLSSHLDLSRLDGVGSAGQGGYSIAAGAQLNFGDVTSLDGDPIGPIRGFLRGAIGGTWADARTVTESVAVATPSATADSVEVDLDVSEQYMTAGVAAGIQARFGLARDFGFGLEARYEVPLNDGLDVEKVGGVRAFLILPLVSE
jgi:hypothetical protein